MTYLKSTDPSLDSDLILDRFCALVPVDPHDCEACFEHGQWWVIQLSTGTTWSVVDAVGPPGMVCGGLSFEQL